MPNPLTEHELQQATEVSWNPAVRRLLDWHRETSAAGATPAAAAAPAAKPIDAAPLSVPVISLSELRKLAGVTQQQIAGLMVTPIERVADIESLDLELLDVDQLSNYTSALGMALSINVELVPGTLRQLYSTRGKVDQLQREQQIAALGGQQALSTETQRGLRQGDGPALSQLAQVVDAGAGVSDTQPPGPGELPDVIDAEPDDEPDPVATVSGQRAPATQPPAPR